MSDDLTDTAMSLLSLQLLVGQTFGITRNPCTQCVHYYPSPGFTFLNWNGKLNLLVQPNDRVEVEVVGGLVEQE